MGKVNSRYTLQSNAPVNTLIECHTIRRRCSQRTLATIHISDPWLKLCEDPCRRRGSIAPDDTKKKQASKHRIDKQQTDVQHSQRKAIPSPLTLPSLTDLAEKQILPALLLPKAAVYKPNKTQYHSGQGSTSTPTGTKLSQCTNTRLYLS